MTSSILPIETVLVPREPTREMMRAADLAYLTMPEDPHADFIGVIYRAALAAAPELSCEAQHALADRLAADLGMVLVNEPEHPDAPGPGGFERAAEAAFARTGTDTATVTADDYRTAFPAPPIPAEPAQSVQALEGWSGPKDGTAIQATFWSPFGGISILRHSSLGRFRISFAWRDDDSFADTIDDAKALAIKELHQDARAALSEAKP